jgi:tetratricopeptide (TPR) repeat protein
LAVQAAQHALQLNPRLALAHATLGYLDLEYLRDWAAAKRELEAAIRLDPNDGESHHWMSHYWISLGRFTEAEAEARRAVECDPLNFSIGSHLAFTKYEEGHFPEAIEAAAATLRLDPAHQPSSFYQIRAYEESGQLSEAIAIRRRIGWNDPPVDALETGLRRDGAAGYWRLCKEFWFRERSAGGPARPSEIAWIYAHLGDQERTLEWLDRAVEERDGWAVYMKVEPPFASLRSDPRFQKISRAAGLP